MRDIVAYFAECKAKPTTTWDKKTRGPITIVFDTSRLTIIFILLATILMF